MTKLGIHDTAGLVRYAVREGVVRLSQSNAHALRWCNCWITPPRDLLPKA